MRTKADHGETSYRGRTACGKVALVTGGDSGIGRAVAIAFAREGADVLISYLNEHEDAEDTARWVEEAGPRGAARPRRPAGPGALPLRRRRGRGGARHIEVLVNNAAYQMTHEEVTEIPDEEWDRTFATTSRRVPAGQGRAAAHAAGASIIDTSSVKSDQPRPTLLPYAATKGAMPTSPPGWRRCSASKGIRVERVAPGPIWTPLIPSTMPPEHVAEFGEQRPLGGPGQPAEVAPAYVLLASDEASYISGALIAVTGGRPIL